MKKTIFILLISGSFLFSYSQEKETITTGFFKLYEKDPLKAYDQLFEGNKWVQKSAIETSKIKLGDFLQQLGAYHGVEPITEKRAGDSYMLKSYLVKYERQPVRFTFILYKAADKWNIQNFTFDDGLSSELEEAAKVNLLRDNWQ